MREKRAPIFLLLLFLPLFSRGTEFEAEKFRRGKEFFPTFLSFLPVLISEENKLR